MAFNSDEILQFHVGLGFLFSVDDNIYEIEQAPDGTIITNRWVEPDEVVTFETVEEPPKSLVWKSGDVVYVRFQTRLSDTIDPTSGITELFSEVKKVGNFPIGGIKIDFDGTISFEANRIDTEIIVPGFPETTLPAFQNLKGRLPIGIIENNDNRYAAMKALIFHEQEGDLTGETRPIDFLSDVFMFDSERNLVDLAGGLRNDQIGDTFFGQKGHILRAVVRKEQIPPNEASISDPEHTAYEGLHFCSPAEVTAGLSFDAPVDTGQWAVFLTSYEKNGVPQEIGAALWDIGHIVDFEFVGLVASVNSIMSKGVCITMNLVAYGV